MKLIFFINADWYCHLHWKERLVFFKNLGFDIHLATNFQSKTTREEFEKIGIICHHIPVSRGSLSIFNIFYSFWIFNQLVKEIRPDLIHTVTVKPNIIGGLIARFKHISIVLSIPGLGPVFNERPPILLYFARILTIFSYQLISRMKKSIFVFENNSDRNLLIKHKAIRENNSVEVAGAGVDLDEFYPGKYPQTRRVLFASRLLKSKGLGDLIEAKKIASKKKNDFELLVAGISDDASIDAIPISSIENYHRQGLIRWLGKIEDMPDLIRKSDLIALPTSYNEGIPRILIEAAACGKPLVATDMPGCKAIIKNNKNGFIVPKNNPDRLLDAILTILNDHELSKRFGDNSRHIAEKKFSSRIIFEQFKTCYNKVLSENLN